MSPRRTVEAEPSPPPPPQYDYNEPPQWWKPGDPAPIIDASRPEVAQAIGRCLVWRLLPKEGVNILSGLTETKAWESLHPRECNWCAYRTEDLQAAVGKAAFTRRYDIISGEYGDLNWSRFFTGATPATRDIDDESWKAAHKRRFAAISDAQYGGIAE